MRFLIVVLAFTVWTSLAQARGAGLGLDLEPIVGYEREQKLVPTPHSHDKLVYGARLTMGLLLLSVEAEYLRGTDNEAFPAQDLTTRDTSDSAKLGLRSSIGAGPFAFVLRGGAQAKQRQHEETQGGVTTKTKEPIKYHPYAGAGFRIRLGRRFAFTADVVAVFTDMKNMNRNEYQTTAGFSVHLP